MAGVTTFLVAVGLTSSVCYVMLVRADRKRARLHSSSRRGVDSSGPSGGEGFGFTSWFGNTAPTDVMGNPIEGGGFDGGSGGGGDGGGAD